VRPLKYQPQAWSAVAATAVRLTTATVTTTTLATIPVATTILATATLAGCGSSAKVETAPVSVGQHLQDLEKARNDGLLTEAEYQQQRKKILEGK